MPGMLRGSVSWPSPQRSNRGSRPRGVIGRDHDAGGSRLGVDESQRDLRAVLTEQTLSCPQHKRVYEEYVGVDQITPHQRLRQLAAAEDHESFPDWSLSLATAVAASPRSRVELIHGSGSFNVVEATYFMVLLSTSVKGLGFGRFGQTA